jgi:hypothetical protein
VDRDFWGLSRNNLTPHPRWSFCPAHRSAVGRIIVAR